MIGKRLSRTAVAAVVLVAAGSIAVAGLFGGKKDKADPGAGDLAVIGTGPDAALGVVQGALIYVLRETGLELMPLGAANEYLGVR